MKLTVNITNFPVINYKVYLDMVAARLRFLFNVNGYRFQNDEQYNQSKIAEAKNLGLTEQDIVDYITECFNSDEDIPF